MDIFDNSIISIKSYLHLLHYIENIITSGTLSVDIIEEWAIKYVHHIHKVIERIIMEINTYDDSNTTTDSVQNLANIIIIVRFELYMQAQCDSVIMITEYMTYVNSIDEAYTSYDES